MEGALVLDWRELSFLSSSYLTVQCLGGTRQKTLVNERFLQSNLDLSIGDSNSTLLFSPGSLDEAKPLNWRTRLDIALNAAQGLWKDPFVFSLYCMVFEQCLPSMKNA